MDPHVSMSMPPADRGGFSAGSGRKRGSRVTHHGREPFGAAAPFHAAWHVAADVPSLRGKKLFRQVRESLRRCCEKEGFRVVHFSVQGADVHFIVEAADPQALARGMQGLGVSIAKRINFTVGRGGAVFRDRYDSRRLRSASEVADALEYVLCNERVRQGRRILDWRKAVDPLPFTSDCEEPGDRIRSPRLWLLRVGWWRRPGLSTWQAAFALRLAA